jgi:type IV pilus assembly protein PilB
MPRSRSCPSGARRGLRVIRILDKDTTQPEFRLLIPGLRGFAEKTGSALRKFIREPYGMVLVTGPTARARRPRSTGASIQIKTDEDKIITIEDPVEYQLPGSPRSRSTRRRG